MQNTGTLKVEAVGDTEILMVRVFDAPAHLVFRAMTDPDIVPRWFGPHGHQVTECEIDLRVGGAWRYVITMPGGATMTMRGRYVEIEPPVRLVHTESFDEFPDQGETVVRGVFDEADGRTTFTATVHAPSREIRDAIVASGMEHGAAETYDRLNDLLREGGVTA